MKYVLLGNGVVAETFLRSARAGRLKPTLLVLNRPDRQHNASGLTSAAADIGVEVAEWNDATRIRLIEWMRSVSEPWLLSIYFGHIIDAEVLDACSGRAINVHPSFLPWNRGAHTNVWPLLDHSPAGVTIHAMVQEVDAGPILVQERVSVEPWDTAATLYERLQNAASSLLERSWPDLILRSWPGQPQPDGGTLHRAADLKRVDNVDVGSGLDARQLYDLLRARSFPPHAGIQLVVDGTRVEATIQLKPVRD